MCCRREALDGRRRVCLWQAWNEWISSWKIQFWIADCGLRTCKPGLICVCFQQHHAGCADRLFRADGSDALASFRLQANLMRIEPQDASDAVSDSILVIGQLRPLGV